MVESSVKVKVAPHSKESEMMVLGCMLTSVNSLNIAADALDESDFYFTEHRIIFQVLKNAYKKDKPADIHLVCEELKRMEKLPSVGGVAYITTLAQYAGTSAFIEEYTEVVKAKSVLRKMIQASEVIEKKALEEPPDVYEALDEAQQLFFHISQAINSGSGILLNDLLSGVKALSGIPYLKELQERQEKFQKLGPNDLGITGMPTHFMDLDRVINGLSPSNLIILAARPAMGKTAFALNVAEHVCFKNEVPVGIFSLEMSSEQLLHRLICSQAEVESEKIRTGSLTGNEYQRIVAAVGNMQQQTMIIDDQPGLKITDLRARARRMKETHQIGLLIIDYLQLLSGSGNNRVMENRQNEISEISRMLKNLARELNVPVICISQLSRKVEERAGHRPMMSDLRESGCLAGETKIKDAKTGQFYTIKELAERKVQTPISVLGLDDDLKLGVHTLSKAFYSGRKIVYELKTRTGRTIKASANHPFRGLEGWIRLDQLKKGDRIAIPREFGIQEPCEKTSSEELILLAHLLGDGSILPRQPYHYTSADKDNIETVALMANTIFQIKPRLVPQKNWFHLYLPSPHKLTHGKHHPITSWFGSLGIERVRSHEKRIPEAVFQCSSSQIALFLHHLWATDGNLSFKKINGRKTSGAIYYASSSKLLCEQTQHLLLSLGIQSTLRITPSSKGYRSMHSVHVQGKTNQTLFLKKVGCSGKRGSIAEDLLSQIEEIKANPNYDVIPKTAWLTIISEAKEQLGISWREISKGLGMSYCGSSLFKNGISRERMGALHRILPKKEILDLAVPDVYWDEILSITEVGLEDVYDATVEGVHNFLANDIIVHNSIEQDADIVIFLLRKEYYDPYDKPGMAELIVAKNRHGSIGTVNLAFRKELGQFANYSGVHLPKQEGEEDPFAAFSSKDR